MATNLKNKIFKDMSTEMSTVLNSTSGRSVSYDNTMNRTMLEFMESVRTNKDTASLAEEQLVDPNNPESAVPLLFLVCGGVSTPDKVGIMSRVLSNYAASARLKDGTLMQPGTMATKFRILMSAFRKLGITMSLTRDFSGFVGSLDGVTKALWTEELVTRPDFGVKPNRRTFQDSDREKLELHVTSNTCDDMKFIHRKMFYIWGAKMLLRGRKEHHDLEWRQVKFGRYPRDYGERSLAGKAFLQIVNLSDKTHKLSLSKLMCATFEFLCLTTC